LAEKEERPCNILRLRRLSESQVVMMEDDIEAIKRAEKEKEDLESRFLTAMLVGVKVRVSI